MAAAGVPGPYLLVGFSFGGLLAIMYAATYPDQVMGLVSLDGSLPTDDQVDQLIPKDEREQVMVQQDANQESVDFYRTTDQAKPLVAKVPDVPVTSTWSSPSSSSRRSTGSSRWPSPILHSMTPTGFPATLPAPRRPDPLAVPALRWGVLGTGWIAERFVHALRTSTTQQVVAVGSRTQASADRFADAAGVLTAHGSPEALVADPGVEVVYVATPHQAHRASALLAIAAGKHVLVEKPMGLDAAQAEEVSAAAATAGVLCMEAMWTLFLPRFDVVRQVLEQGLLGDVRTVLADHGERFDPPHRILDPAMAGGSLLDLGCYLTALATWTLGPAQDVYATGEMTPSGVNGQAAMVLTHGGGARSVLHTTLLTRTPTAAVIAGTAATLTLPGPFFMPGDVVLTSADGNRTVTRAEPEPIGHGGLYHSAVEVALRVSAGDLESPLRPATDVVAGLRALDEVGRQLGVRYDAAR